MLTLQYRPSGWWIIGLPDLDVPECGPYDTKAEAEDDRRGLVRFFKCENDVRFWHTNPPIREGV